MENEKNISKAIFQLLLKVLTDDFLCETKATRTHNDSFFSVYCYQSLTRPDHHLTSLPVVAF